MVIRRKRSSGYNYNIIIYYYINKVDKSEIIGYIVYMIYSVLLRELEDLPVVLMIINSTIVWLTNTTIVMDFFINEMS